MSDVDGSSNWRELVAAHDQVAHDKMVAYIGHVAGLEEIPPLYREMILFAAAAVIRFRPSMATHAERALDEGATDQQLFQAVALASLTGGFTCMIEGLRVLDDITSRKHDQDG